jgi:LemA protein
MEMIYILIGTVVGLILLILIVGIVLKNGLISKSNQVDASFATVDVMLKKRFDLIPQLMGCVEGYMSHEKELLSKLTELRSVPRDVESLSKVNRELGASFSQFLIKSEAYPDLKASDQFLMLQRSINEMEEQLAASRRTYNVAIQDYNDLVLKFPSNIVAQRNKLEQKRYFEFHD